jgi:hypothetical protein
MEARLDHEFAAQADAIREYIAGMEYWMRGNLEYSRISRRYYDIEASQEGQPVSWIENLTFVPQTCLFPPMLS